MVELIEVQWKSRKTKVVKTSFSTHLSEWGDVLRPLPEKGIRGGVISRIEDGRAKGSFCVVEGDEVKGKNDNLVTYITEEEAEFLLS